jgi:hypothetical protein
MRGERGQASIEWIGGVLLVALLLGTLARTIPGRVEAHELAATVLDTTVCASRGGCHDCASRGRCRDCASRGGCRDRAGAQAGAERPSRAVTAPPLLPLHRGERPTPRPRPRLVTPPRLLGPARRATRVFWRQAWVLCFTYERARYGLLHPETGPRQTVPVSGALQMVNDCASPIDFSRDWEHLRPR